MESSTVILEHEHRIVQRVVAGMAVLADELDEGKQVKPQLLKEIVKFLRVFVDQCHHAKEDKYLFPPVGTERCTGWWLPVRGA